MCLPSEYRTIRAKYHETIPHFGVGRKSFAAGLGQEMDEMDFSNLDVFPSPRYTLSTMNTASRAYYYARYYYGGRTPAAVGGA